MNISNLKCTLTTIKCTVQDEKVKAVLKELLNALQDYQLVPNATLDKDAKRLQFLASLEAYGVDNWDGYSEAYSSVFSEEDDE